MYKMNKKKKTNCPNYKYGHLFIVQNVMARYMYEIDECQFGLGMKEQWNDIDKTSFP